MQIKLCYINQHWNIYLYIDGQFQEGETKTSRNEKGVYRLTKYSHPEIPEAYSFGFMADNPRERPGHGGEWSSNESTIGDVFDINIWGIAVNHVHLGVPFEWIVKLLGNDCDWQDDDVYTKWVKNVKGIENKDHRWIVLNNGKWELEEDSSYKSMKCMIYSSHR
jgi:hypothetical protein